MVQRSCVLVLSLLDHWCLDDGSPVGGHGWNLVGGWGCICTSPFGYTTTSRSCVDCTGVGGTLDNTEMACETTWTT